MRKFFKFKWLTPKKALLITIALFGILLITNGEPYVRSDGFCYYTISKSLINEHSFISTNRPEYWDYMGHVKETYNGKYISVCAPGSALFNLPGLIIANLLKGDRNINNDYFIAYNGHTILEGLSFLFTAMIVGLASIIVTYKTLRRLKYSERLSMFSTALVFISSYALWYIFLYPSYTHIYEIFGIALTFYGFVRYLNSKKDRVGAILMGAGIGVSVITRPVLIPVGLMILLYMIYKKDFINLIKTGLAGFPFAVIYLAYNFVSYGKFITTGYGDVRGENFTATEFHQLDVLFSPYRGLFVFTPILLPSVFGLIILWKKYKALSLIGILSILSVATIYGFWPAWWGGGSYGSRFMMFVVPIGCIGLSTLINYLKDRKFSRFKFLGNKSKLFKIVVILSIFFTLYSGSILILYRITPVGQGFYTPLHFFKTQINYISRDGVIGYIKSIPKYMQDGSGIMALLTGVSDYVVTVIPGSTTENAIHVKLKLFAPPKSNQPLNQNIKFYIANKDTETVYVAEIEDFKPGQIISLVCTFTCSSQNNQFRILGMEDIETLPLSEYEGITINHINFFFKRGENVQYRGNFIPLRIEDPIFKVKK